MKACAPVSTAPPHVDAYVAAFVARCEAMRPVGRPVVVEPGVLGLLPSDEDPSMRLLVTDDRAYDVLARLLPGVRAGMVNVFAGAVRCADLLLGLAAWRPEATTALILPDLRTVPAPMLLDSLRLRPVRRRPDDGPGGVPLEDAVAAALRADPSIDDPRQALAGYLRSLPGATRLLAAIDGDGVVRATSGCAVFGDGADVLFVNTDPNWRGRGVGLAMTAAALRAAREHGARFACLDATDAGLSIYRRLGFEVVTPTTRFFAQSPSTS
jgi:ribosomal protein S18 acetylase RimI-like enzyme